MTRELTLEDLDARLRRVEAFDERLKQVERQLANLAPLGPQPRRVSLINAIIADATAAMEVAVDDVVSSRRGRGDDFAHTRFAVAWAARQAHRMSLERIGLALNHHHTSVSYMLRRSAELRALDGSFRQLTDLLVERANERKSR